MNLPDKFKFKSTVNSMNDIIYTAIKVENSYVITWNFLGDQSMVMKDDTMQYHFQQKEYEFAW